MTRIISGRSGGRRLATPAGAGTRPTSDRVREALFSRLEHLDAIEGIAVLDLYAGSGALGLEALSRGASRVVLVEAARKAASVARRNAAEVSRDVTGTKDAQVPPLVRVVAETVERYLRTDDGERYGLVFIDPPYDLSEAALSAVLADLTKHLEPESLVIIERSSRSPEPVWPESRPARQILRVPSGLDRPAGVEGLGLHLVDARAYGETRLWFVRAQAPER